MRGLPGRKKSGRRKGVSLWCCIRRLQNGDIPPSALNGEKPPGRLWTEPPRQGSEEPVIPR